jgi:hypothetical protein
LEVIMLRIVLSQIACIIFLVLPALSQDKWEKADLYTTRLSPDKFTDLPATIVEHLVRKNCTIPQSFIKKDPHNVVNGEFLREGQFDWAVLCSVNRNSSILVFVGGSVEKVLTLAKGSDANYLQTIDGNGTLGFSRVIGSVEKSYIEARYRSYGSPKLPTITHSGLADAFVEKSSTVHYYHQGKWLALQGAD